MTHSSRVNGIASDYLSLSDRALQYGDGLFETLACRNRRLQYFDLHLDRLKAGARRLGIDYPEDALWKQDIETLLEETGSDHLVFKMMLSRGAGERGYRTPRDQRPVRIVTACSWPESLQPFPEEGARLCLCDSPVSLNRKLAGIKHLNRLDSVLARAEWNDEYDEGLMLDNDGRIIEGTASNVFFVRAGRVLTPALDVAGVEGVIRQRMIALCENASIPCDVTTIRRDELDSMDEAFITSSLLPIRPVVSIAEHHYKQTRLGQRITALLKDDIRNHE